MYSKRSKRCDICKVTFTDVDTRTCDVCDECKKYIEANIKHTLQYGNWRNRSSVSNRRYQG